MGELKAGAPLQNVYWQDRVRAYTFADILGDVARAAEGYKNSTKRSLVILEDLEPRLCWIHILAAWSQDLAVLPLAKGVERPEIPVDHNHECDLYILTSGSTGSPKAVGHTIDSLTASARATVDFYKYLPGDSWLLSLDPAHIGGLQILIRSWIAGGKVLYWGEPKEIAEALNYFSPDFLSLVPTQLFLLLNLKKLKKAKAILLGGAKTQTSLMERARQENLPVSITYGSSETASQISAFAPGVYPEGEGDVGQVLPIWNVQSTDNALTISGPALFKGYFQNHIWTETGKHFSLPDQGHLKDGELYIEGRSDEIFQVGGENVSPKEILTPLESIANLSDLMVLTKDDTKFGKIPLLIVRSLRQPDITTYLIQLNTLKPIKRPREIWWFQSDEVSKLSKARLQTLLNTQNASMKRLWHYEKL